MLHCWIAPTSAAENGAVFPPSQNIPFHPLRIVKQAVSMFLAAQPGLGPIDWNPLRRFVLRRDDPLPPGPPSILLYYNSSSTGRVVLCCGLSQLCRRIPVIALSEISYPPLVVVFAST